MIKIDIIFFTEVLQSNHRPHSLQMVEKKFIPAPKPAE